jgi:EmrB/QacA subfamily drug resistance transporter
VNKWVVLSVASIGTLMSTVDGGVASVAYPALAGAFEVDTSTVVWFTVAFWVTTVGLMLTLGWIGDLAGRRRMFIGGFLLFAAGLVFTSVAANIWQVIASRVVQGVGSAMLLSNLNALITSSFPPEERGKALGVSGAVVGIGLSAGPLVGGLLIDVLDWRALFYTRAPMGVIGAVLSWLVLPQDTVPGGSVRVDVWGAVSVFGSLACFLLVVNQGGNLGFGSPAVITLALATGLFSVLLAWTQRRAARPILDFALFRTRQYALSLSILFTHYLSYGAIMLAAPFLLADGMGFSATKMGLYIAAFYFGRTVLAPVAGRASDRFDPRPFLVIGNIVLAAGFVWLSVLGTPVSERAFLSGVLLAGVGSALFEPVVTSGIMGSVPRDRLGTASASVAVGRQLAFAIGVALAGAIFTIREGVYLDELSATGSPAATAGADAIARGFADAMLSGVALALIAVVLSLWARRPRVERRS